MKNNKIDRRHFIKASVAGASAFTFSRPLFAQTESPVATTKYGMVRGYTEKGVKCFKGIRYGADTSARRFMAPLPPEKWDGIIDATNYGKSSPQQSRGDSISED